MSYFAVTHEAGFGWIDGKRRLQTAQRPRPAVGGPVGGARVRLMPKMSKRSWMS